MLIQGETGSGKDLVAQALHASSPRRRSEMVAVNCAALPGSLLETELFGVEKGAYTGADVTRPGLCETASGGTLFLDEVGEFALPAQPKLLRALESRQIRRIGGREEIAVNIRVIAATHRDLVAMSSKNAFRSDLMFRLNVVRLRVPPLRAHRDDIPLLAAEILKRVAETNHWPVCRISDGALRLLMEYHWPGNVRELHNVLEHAAVMGDGMTIDESHIACNLAVESAPPPEPFQAQSYRSAVDEYRRQLIAKAIIQANYNLRDAAKLLQLNPNSLYRRVHKLKLTHLIRNDSAAR